MSSKPASRSSTSKAAASRARPRPSAARPSATRASAARASVAAKTRQAEDDPDDDLDGEIPEPDEIARLEEAKSQLKEDPVLDRRIIEGMLRDRKQLLDELAKEGMSSTVVLRRAAELGLSEALLRQVKGVAADLAGERPGRRPMPSSLGARTCLSCDRVFLSTGPGNRLCMRCRGGDAGLAQF